MRRSFRWLNQHLNLKYCTGDCTQCFKTDMQGTYREEIIELADSKDVKENESAMMTTKFRVKLSS